jgi:hypothetical protein
MAGTPSLSPRTKLDMISGAVVSAAMKVHSLARAWAPRKCVSGVPGP